MPFLEKGNGGANFPDANHNGIPDAAEAIFDGVHAITPSIVIGIEEDVTNLEENKMNKTDPIDGGTF